MVTAGLASTLLEAVVPPKPERATDVLAVGRDSVARDGGALGLLIAVLLEDRDEELLLFEEKLELFDENPDFVAAVAPTAKVSESRAEAATESSRADFLFMASRPSLGTSINVQQKRVASNI